MKYAVIFALLFTVGCKRCYECDVLNTDGEINYSYLDVCATNKEFEAYERLCIENLDSSDVCRCRAIE